MHSLEALGVNDSTTEATGAGEGGGLSLAVCTHRLGHCPSKVALISGRSQTCGTDLPGLKRII